MKGIAHCELFGAWLLSLSIITLRFIHVVSMSSFIPSYCWGAPQSVCPPLQQTLRVTVTAAPPARWPLPPPLHEPTLPRVPATGSQNFPVCLDDSDLFLLPWSITHRAFFSLSGVPWFGQSALGSSRGSDPPGSSPFSGRLSSGPRSHRSPGSPLLLLFSWALTSWAGPRPPDFPAPSH